MQPDTLASLPLEMNDICLAWKELQEVATNRKASCEVVEDLASCELIEDLYPCIG